MENLKYVSTAVRLNILNAYCELWHIDSSDFEKAESWVFGNPIVRRMVDKGIDQANTEVDLERYEQHSTAWYQDVVKNLPGPAKWDSLEYADYTVEHDEPVKKPKDYIQTVEGYKQFRDKIDEILEEFDFARVHKVMESLDWTWAFWTDRDYCEHQNEVPDEYALRKVARKLLIDAVERGQVGTGGFETTAYVYDYNPDNEPDDFEHQVCLALKFVVESFGEI